MAGFGYDHRIRVRVEIPAHAVGISHSDGRYSRGKITSRRRHVMPAYEMTPDEALRYGNGLTIWQAMRLLHTWSPLIQYGQRFLAEPDTYRKGLIVTEACEWLASKTDSRVDDELVQKLAGVARTPQGEELIRFCLQLAGVA